MAPRPVTDSRLLAELESRQPVTDKALLAELEGQQPVTNQALLAELEGTKPPSWGEVVRSIPRQIAGRFKLQVQGAALKSAESLTAPVRSGFNDFVSPFQASAAVEDAQRRLRLRAGTPATLAEARELKNRAAQVRMIEGTLAELEAGTPQNQSFWQRAVSGVAVSVATGAPALVAGIATKNPALAASAFGGQTYFADYGRYRAGGLSPERSASYAGVNAVLEAGTEFLPAKALFKSGSEPLKRLTQFLTSELPGENLANLGQTITDHLAAYGEEVTAGEFLDAVKSGTLEALKEIPEVSATAALAGGVQVGAVEVLDRAARALSRPDRAPADPDPTTPLEAEAPEQAVREPVTDPKLIEQLESADAAPADAVTAGTAATTEGSPAGTPTDVEAAHGVQQMAGAQYVPMLQTQAAIPAAQTITVAPGTAIERTVEVPKEPVRREHIMREFQQAFGVKVYQGAPFKIRSALGFHRPKTGEVRVRAHNDLEVTAHEVFHWLDRNVPELRKLYHEKRFGDELKGISYDQAKLNEGFAEFGRLFMTQAQQAAARTPQFYAAFIATAKQAGVLDKLLRIQGRMHQWYYQGAEGRARSKIGTDPAPFRDRLADATDRLPDRAILQALDALQGFKVVERDVAGTVQDATVSPYKAARLVAGARGVGKAILNHGTVGWHQSGDIIFTGKGLKQIFNPVADVIEDALAYFVGRRAQELAGQGREKLFTPEEIQALVDIPKLHVKGVEIRRAFAEYQDFIDRMMDFYEASGLVSGESRRLMREMNANYVPFHRIRETLEAGDTGAPAGQFRRLKGGTQNLRDIFENITGSVQVLTAAALKNRAKQQLYALIESSPKGGQYAVRVATERHPTKIDPEWLLRKVNEFIDDNALAKQAVETIAQHPEFGEKLLYWSGQYEPSAPDIDMVLVNGKPRYYQVGDPLLMDSLQAFNTAKPLGLILKVLGGFSNTLRRGVTLMPDFLIPNLLRDSFNAATLSKGGQLPLAHSLAGMVTRLKGDRAYWEFLANGGGFSSQIHGETQELRTQLERFYAMNGIDYRTVLDTPQKLIDGWDELASAFEYGTRLAEFKLLREKGSSAREAALQGREISTDFAMRGAAEWLRAFAVGVPFLNARLQGLYRLQREMLERDGRLRLNPKQTLRFTARALVTLTIPSMALWWFNHDDERYKALPDWIRLTHWVILKPDGVFLIPKPFEVGAMFASVPEQTLEYLAERDGPKYAEALAFLAVNALSVTPVPQAVKPAVDIARNKNWAGAPIVPERLQGVAASEQFTPFTSDTMLRVGRTLGLSPLKLDYLLKGYLGTLGQYALTATDALLDPAIDTGEKPAGIHADDYVIRRFIRQAPYKGTAFEQEFYKVLEQTREAVATFRKIEKDRRAGDLKTRAEDPEQRVLLAISQGTERLAAKASEINGLMTRVRVDPTMSAEEKRRELDKLQFEKNLLFDAAHTVFSRKNVRALAEAED